MFPQLQTGEKEQSFDSIICGQSNALKTNWMCGAFCAFVSHEISI